MRLRVASYDDFFKAAQEIHALVHQATQTVGQLRRTAAKRIATKDLQSQGAAQGRIDQALGRGKSEHRSAFDSSFDLRQVARGPPSAGCGQAREAREDGSGARGGGSDVPHEPEGARPSEFSKKGLVSSIVVLKESSSVLVAFEGLAGVGDARTALRDG